MAIYQAKFLQPYNTTIDGTAINPFTFVCQGTTITKYNAKIYRVSDNVQVYTTGDIVLSPVKYNNDTVSFNVPALTVTNGTQYKWDVTTFENATSATSFQVTFWANAIATLTMTVPATITAQSYTFTATYSQANSVPLSYYYFVLSDVTGEIERTDATYSGSLSFKFQGFVSGNSYGIQVFGVTNNGASVQSPKYNFNVTYPKPSIDTVLQIIQDCKSTMVNIVWGTAVQILGTISGTYAYIQNYMSSNYYAIQLNSGAYYSANLTIPDVFSTIVQVKPNGFTTGKIVELTGSSGSYEIGYDGTRFYYNNKSVLGYSIPIALPTTDYILVVNPTDAYVKINSVQYRIFTT